MIEAAFVISISIFYLLLAMICLSKIRRNRFAGPILVSSSMLALFPAVMWEIYIRTPKVISFHAEMWIEYSYLGLAALIGLGVALEGLKKRNLKWSIMALTCSYPLYFYTVVLPIYHPLKAN